MTNLRIFLPVLIGAATAVCFAQPNRVLSRIDNARKVTLAGHVVPMANAANDAGAVETSFPLSITLLLKPTAAQQASLEQLLQDQQNPASPSYHKWLTPEQYADQFGASSNDTSQIVAWLQTQGFTVDPVSRSRTFITFAATAGQVHASFGAAIHRYTANGKSHYANASNPTVPAALASVVAGFRGLHDFHPRAHLSKSAKPRWTLGPGDHVMAPDDFAAIYDIAPLYTAGTNGTGQSIAIVGQSALYSSGSDVTAFWSQFGITGAKLVPKLISPRDNPGVVEGDVEESSLDTEWAGAVARDANIVFVYSQDVWDSAQYAVDNDVAPVLSMSYGQCEGLYLGILPSNRQLVQQANAEGITWLAAAGDAGAADCDAGNVVAEGGLAVDAPGSIPEVTSMGGTTFNDGSGNYWNSGNTPTKQSAKGYIPESAWNESAINGSILAGGGGASMFFPQPSWQTSTSGMPQDGWRHVPDISFNSSVYNVPYYVYCVLCEGSENGANYFGGTSAATPTMAGVVALLNQSLNQNGLGNINPIIYRLGQTAPTAFHDVTTGNNMVACGSGSPGCNNGEQGYSATVGYDSATGFGSVDVANLVRQWSTGVSTGSLVVPSIDQNPVYQTNPGQWTFQLTLTEEAGISTTLTGFTINGVSYSSQIAAIFGTPAIPARQSISGSYTLALTSVPANETFGFSGVDSTGMQWSTALTIPFQGPQAQLAVGGATNAASYQQVYAPGMLMAVFGTGLGTLAQSAGTIPLPEFMAGFEGYICPISCETGINYPVPLYYVGPNQVNLQIPYEVSGPVDLNLNNPYQTIDYYFTVSTVAPGIFTFQNGLINPSSTGSPGQTVFMYITGEGRVSPALPDGTSPAPGTPIAQSPKPRQQVTVTVAGIPAGTTSTLPFIGIPWGLVGVTQINFTIPPNVPSGKQPVVVTVGTTPTPPAYIMIQ
jgi:uncharacterized protein (TIGR03437 family)